MNQSPTQKVENSSSQGGSQTNQSPTQKVANSSSQGGIQMSRSQQLSNNQSARGPKPSTVTQSSFIKSSRPMPPNIARANPIGLSIKNDDSDDDLLHHLFVRQLSSSLSMKSQMPQSINLICTFAASGTTLIAQEWYECRTCNLVNGLCMCEVCAHNCHKGHNVVCIGMSNGCFCDCPQKCNCKCCSTLRMQSCTSERYMGPITQPMYRCRSCDDEKLICQYCAINHHHGHNLQYLGVVKNKICCNDEIGRFSRSVILTKRRLPFDSDSDSD